MTSVSSGVLFTVVSFRLVVKQEEISVVPLFTESSFTAYLFPDFSSGRYLIVADHVGADIVALASLPKTSFTISAASICSTVAFSDTFTTPSSTVTLPNISFSMPL